METNKIGAKNAKSHDVPATMFCGGIAGVMAKSAVAPVERVKMSFQTWSGHRE